MTIATKSGSLIVKDGKLAENCGCCGGWYCCIDRSCNPAVATPDITSQSRTVVGKVVRRYRPASGGAVVDLYTFTCVTQAATATATIRSSVVVDVVANSVCTMTKSTGESNARAVSGVWVAVFDPCRPSQELTGPFNAINLGTCLPLIFSSSSEKDGTGWNEERIIESDTGSSVVTLNKVTISS